VSASRPRLVSRTVLLLALASFCNDVASELLLKGALPLYLVGALGAPMVAVALIDGAAETVATLLQIGSGWWADRIGRRRPFVLAGYLLSNTVKPLLAFAGSWWVVLAIRVSDRVGKGLRVPPRDALIAETTPPEQRGRAFGLNHALDPAGAMVSLIAGAIIIRLSQDPHAPIAAGTFRNLVLFIVLPGLATVALTLAVREPRATPPPCPRVLAGTGSGGGDLGRPFWRFLALSALFGLGNSTDSFVIVRASQTGLSTPTLFLLLAAFNLTTVLSSLPAGALSDRLGRRGFLAAGWMLYAAVYAGLAISSAPTHIAAWLLVYGVYYGLTEGVAKAMVADLVPPERRATAYGLLAAVQGLCVLPAGLVGGWLWSAISPSAPFFLGSGLALAAAVGLRWVAPARETVHTGITTAARPEVA
jgi:MFS family permease